MVAIDYGGDESPRQASSGGEEKISVSVRLRPLNAKEIASNNASDWECINDNTIVFKNGNLSMSPAAYTFDRVFSSDCSTRQVYEEGAKAVALSVVNGINSSIFAYGQTSSGKTYTMTGITEYTIADIYDYTCKHKDRDFVLKFSAMEIYNECVRDLLSSDNSALRLLDDPERGTIVEKLTEDTLRDWDHVMELLSICQAQRQIGETSLNETSSRSHQIIRVTIESSPRGFSSKGNPSTLAASVNFVDLAGSERASQTLSVGTRLKEGCHINRSLLTLGTVIRKLSKGRNGHVPFRDSKLTRILQSSLGGNAKTAIICTMSLARCHVEQSRNTLLFASCAKEVRTHARVNVVMSDKTLVKHLRRELARLQNEMRSPEQTFPSSEWAALLREKDLLIEKLEKEIIDLILQRDVVQAQLQDLLHVVGDDAQSMLWGGLSQYPHLRVRKSPESDKASSFGNPQSMGIEIKRFDSSRYSDTQSGSSCEDHYIHLPDLDGNFLSDSRHGWGEEIEEQSSGSSEDLCKEVRCIETEESNSTSDVESNVVRCIETEESNSTSDVESNVVRCIETEESNSTSDAESNEDRCIEMEESSSTTDVESNHSSVEENIRISMPNMNGDEDRTDQEHASPPLEEDKELSFIRPPLVVLSPEKPSPGPLAENSSSTRSLSLKKSRSWKESFTISSSAPWFSNLERSNSISIDGFEKLLTGRSEDIPRKFCSLHYGAEVESLSRKESQSSCLGAPSGELEEQEEMTDAHHEKQVAASPAQATEPQEITASKNVGLDCIEGYSESPSRWPSEFKRLQREIIELWDACNVSVVHRTYFFLLFKGDPADSIYMQVEHRRLSFLKDTFARGSKTVEDGRTITPASSMKALRREREMLSREMEKKLSEAERDCLFLKWGIPLDSKYRRLQLANRLWTKTHDMNHIEESAGVIARVVGFNELGQAPKEMFGLNFAPHSGSRFYGLKSKVKSIL